MAYLPHLLMFFKQENQLSIYELAVGQSCILGSSIFFRGERSSFFANGLKLCPRLIRFSNVSFARSQRKLLPFSGISLLYLSALTLLSIALQNGLLPKLTYEPKMKLPPLRLFPFYFAATMGFLSALNACGVRAQPKSDLA